MRVIDFKSWKLFALLICLAGVVGATLIETNDTIRFFCELHFGTEKMKVDCVSRLFDAKTSLGSERERQAAEASLPPEWIWRYLAKDRNPWTRVTIAKTLWYLHPKDERWLSALMAETDNSNAEIRDAALGELYDMNECFSTVSPILRKHLFEDKDELPRRAASLSLLALSTQNPDARKILDSAAQDLNYESTKDFVSRKLKWWDESHKP
jgi:hypothetical protein